MQESRIIYEVGPDPSFPSEWRAEGIDSKTGDVSVALFGSANAETNARQYVAYKESQNLRGGLT